MKKTYSKCGNDHWKQNLYYFKQEKMNSRVEFGPTISIRFYSFKIKCATRFLFQFYI